MSLGEAANHPIGTMRHTRLITGGGLLLGGPRGISLHIGVDSIDPTITTASTLRIMEGSVTVRTGEVAAGTGRWVVDAEIIRRSEFSSRILGLTGIALAV